MRLSAALLAALLQACGGGGSSGPATPPAPTVTIAVLPDHVAQGNSATLTWSSTDATACSASGAWSGAQATAGSLSVTPAALGAQTYMLSCSGAGGSGSGAAVLTVTAVNASLAATVASGLAPINGAQVMIFAAGDSSPLGIGTTGADGKVSVGFSNPGGNAVLYALASGGDAGHGINAAIRLAAVLGTGASFIPVATLNERTTVSTAWAMARFFGVGGISGKAPGLQNAAATAANLSDVASGAAAAAITSGANAPDKLNTLANLLAACVASVGASSLECAGLFGSATASGSAPPTDTLAAALSVARHPGSNVAALFALASSGAAFTPALGAAPDDWTLALNYTGGGLSSPTEVALDAVGNVWVANYLDSVSKFSPSGVALSPAAGYTGGGLHESYSLAVDAAGNVWVTNNESPGSLNSGHGSVTKLAADGTVLSPPGGFAGGGLYFPQWLVIDTGGSVWTANYAASSLSRFDAAGAPLSPTTGYTGGGLSFPVGLAFDPAGNLWAANSGADTASKFSSAGAPISSVSGYAGGGIRVPYSVAVDQRGYVWLANQSGASVTALDSLGSPLSPIGGYTGGGLNAPAGVAIDAAGTIWVTNYYGGSITALSGSGVPLSPSTGYTGGGLLQPFSPAIDSAGNLWTANFGNSSLTEFIGVAAPIRTPLIGVPAAP